MSAQAAKPPVKITYATMSGDQLEELHGALDAAIPAVQAAFGQTHPMWINGHAVQDRRSFPRHQPHRHAHRPGPVRQRQRAARPRRHQRRAGGVSGLEPDVVAGAREAAAARGGRHPRAPVGTVGADGLRGRQDAPRVRRRRRGVGRPHRVLLRPDGAERRLHQADEHPRPGRGERQRAAAVRGVGGDLAVQLPARPRGRARQAARSWPATPWCSSRPATRPTWACASPRS